VKPYFFQIPGANIGDDQKNHPATIHVDDVRFRTLVGKHGGDANLALADYQAVGQAVGTALAQKVVAHNGAAFTGGKVESEMTVLDFGSEFGFLARYLPAIFPRAKIVAGERTESGKFFDQIDLGLEAAFLGSSPGEMQRFFRFDVVLAYDVLTRVRPDEWREWLDRIIDFAAPNGLVVFTTQGAFSLANRFRNRPLDDEGFYFMPVQRSAHVPGQPRGETIVAAATVFRTVDAIGGARVVEFQEAALSVYHDVFVLRRQ
jgi:Methyltransferase domain